MKSILSVAVAVVALSFVGSSEASAQGYGCSSGYGAPSYYGGGYSSPGLSVNIGYRSPGGYSNPNYGYGGFNSGWGGYNQSGFGGYPSYGSHVHRTWHNTTHLDYDPPSLVPHRGHLDYVPGHYDLHRTGHWDMIRH